MLYFLLYCLNDKINKNLILKEAVKIKKKKCNWSKFRKIYFEKMIKILNYNLKKNFLEQRKIQNLFQILTFDIL